MFPFNQSYRPRRVSPVPPAPVAVYSRSSPSPIDGVQSPRKRRVKRRPEPYRRPALPTPSSPSEAEYEQIREAEPEPIGEPQEEPDRESEAEPIHEDPKGHEKPIREDTVISTRDGEPIREDTVTSTREYEPIHEEKVVEYTQVREDTVVSKSEYEPMHEEPVRSAVEKILDCIMPTQLYSTPPE